MYNTIRQVGTKETKLLTINILNKTKQLNRIIMKSKIPK